MNDKELDARLTQWAAEYGGGRYENLGYAGSNTLARLIEHQGFVPDRSDRQSTRFRTPADEIEAHVVDMAQHGLEVAAKVIRMEYFRARWPIEAKLQRMRRDGAGSKSAYYVQLRVAKAWLVARLTDLALPAVATAPEDGGTFGGTSTDAGRHGTH